MEIAGICVNKRSSIESFIKYFAQCKWIFYKFLFKSSVASSFRSNKQHIIYRLLRITFFNRQPLLTISAIKEYNT